MKFETYAVILLSSLLMTIVACNNKSENKSLKESRVIDVQDLPKCENNVIERWKKDNSENSMSFKYERMKNSKTDYVYFNTTDGESCLSSL